MYKDADGQLHMTPEELAAYIEEHPDATFSEGKPANYYVFDDDGHISITMTERYDNALAANQQMKLNRFYEFVGMDEDGTHYRSVKPAQENDLTHITAYFVLDLLRLLPHFPNA